MMAKAASLSLDLEERMALLSMLGCSSPDALDEQAVSELSEEQLRAGLRQGEESLLQRGLITYVGDDSLVLGRAAAALFGTVHAADAVLLLTRSAPGAEGETHIFAAAEGLLVEVRALRQRARLYRHVPDGAALRRRLAGLLAPLRREGQPGPAAGSLRLPGSAFSVFLALARQGDAQGAGQSLQTAGMAAEPACSLAEDAQGAPLWVGAVTWGLFQDEPGFMTLTALLGRSTTWLVEGATNSHDDVLLRPADGRTCVRAFLGLAERLIGGPCVANLADVTVT